MRLVQGYVIGLPLWWMSGFDFIMPAVLAVALVATSLTPHRWFAPCDYLVGIVILLLGVTAYVNGYIVAHEMVRLVAALYNLSLWICGLLILQQVRHLLKTMPAARPHLLRSCYSAFVLFAVVSWGALVAAYLHGNFSQEYTSLFGATLGDLVPKSASLIRQSATLNFSRPDWGLPGISMPRIMVYGPYPTATGAVAAVLGSLALLHLNGRPRVRRWHVVAIELIVLASIASTLTRSILGGWVVGAILANLVFGTSWRRIAACGAILAGLLAVAYSNVTSAAQYRSYSTESRFENYDRAIAQTLATNPLLGLGIKPREEDLHIAVGSHSTFVSTFTKGGALTLAVAAAWLVLIPGLRWVRASASAAVPSARAKAEMRILLNLQIAIWVWLCFEDLDAPATASMLIFLAIAFIEATLRSAAPPRVRPLPRFA